MDWQNPNECQLQEGWCLLLFNSGLVIGGWLWMDSFVEAGVKVETARLYYGPAWHDKDNVNLDEVIGWCPVKGLPMAKSQPTDWALDRTNYQSKWRSK